MAGLAIEASTIDTLVERLKIVIPELIELNQQEIGDTESPFMLDGFFAHHNAAQVHWSATLPRSLNKVLKSNDWYFVRKGKGDHEIWFSPISQKNFVVDGKIKSRHTANAALQQAGLDKQF